MSSTQETGSGWGFSFGDYWKQPGVTGSVKQTCDSVQKTCDSLQKILEDPASFFASATSGIMHAASPSEGESSNPLLQGVKQIVKSGVSSTSLVVIEQLLQNSVTYDLDETDANLRETVLNTIKHAKQTHAPLQETAEKVWASVNKYHIIFGSMNPNKNPSSNTKMREQRIHNDGEGYDGDNPISALDKCQESWRLLREQHGLSYIAEPETPSPATQAPAPPTPEELQKRKKLEEETNKIVEAFSKKIVHFSTMHAIHQIFGPAISPSLYLKVLEQGGNFETGYLKLFSDQPIRRFFYKLAYRLIAWLIQPLIVQTITQAITQLRTFLKDDDKLLKFIERIIGDLADYYGRIELGRQKFLAPDRTDEAGTFDRFLEQTIKVYDGKYSKEQLIAIFKEYLIKCVPKPTIPLFGYRVPLLSALLEGIVFFIRKLLTKKILEKTKIIEKLQNPSIKFTNRAQLGLQRIIKQKIAETIKTINRFRCHTVSPSDPQAQQNYKVYLHAKRMIAEIHPKIEEHSEKLLRFIEIELCNGNLQKLRNLDNRVSNLVKDIIYAITDSVKWDPPFISKILEKASTEVMETVLVSMLQDKDNQIETNIQSVFQLLDTLFVYVPEEEKAEKERVFRAEKATADENLSTLLEQLSRTAANAALEFNWKQANREHHQAVKNYVKQEEECLNEFIQKLESEKTELLSLMESAGANHADCKHRLSSIVSRVENYLSYVTLQLNSSGLAACYHDVRGDLHNIYAVAIHMIDQFYTHVDTLASQIDQLGTYEQEQEKVRECQEHFASFFSAPTQEEAQTSLEYLQAHIPTDLEDTILPAVNELNTCKVKQEEIVQSLTLSDTFTELTREKNRLEEKIKLCESVEKQFQELINYTKSYKNLSTNQKFTTKEKVNEEKARLVALIQNTYKQIAATPDSEIISIITPLSAYASTDSEGKFCVKVTRFQRVLCGSFFSRKTSLVSRIQLLRSANQKQLLSVQKQLSVFKTSPTPRLELEKQLADVQNQMVELYADITKKFGDFEIKNTNDSQALLESMTTASNEAFVNLIYMLKDLNTQFYVKGCISVEGATLYNWLASMITPHFTSQITKGTRALIRATSKPKYAEQLFIRLFLVNLANYCTNSS